MARQRRHLATCVGEGLTTLEIEYDNRTMAILGIHQGGKIQGHQVEVTVYDLSGVGPREELTITLAKNVEGSINLRPLGLQLEEWTNSRTGKTKWLWPRQHPVQCLYRRG